jgi:hypothetical protein
MFRFGEIGQWLGMAVSISGLTIEIIAKADIGWALLTFGSLVWAIGTKVKYHRGRKGVPRAPGHRVHK